MLRLAAIEPAGLLAEDADRSEEAIHDRLRAIVEGVALRIAPVSDAPDRYGRTPAIVVAEGDIVQETLLREGLALAFGTDDPLPCFDRLLAAEEQARRERRGVWAEASVASAFPDALQSRIGRFAIFEGRVLSVGNRRATTYLNFGDWWRDDVTAEIAAADRKRFGGEDRAGRSGGSKSSRSRLSEGKGRPDDDRPLARCRSRSLEPAKDDSGIAP